MKTVLLILLILSSFTAFPQNNSGHEEVKITRVLTDREKANRTFINTPYPGFSFVSKGDTISNALFQNKTVFINFWFEACPPCVAEFDALSEMYREMKQFENAEFITFTFETDSAIAKIRKKYNLDFRIVSIPREECYRLNNNNGFPTSILVDSSGRVKWIFPGGSSDKEKARRTVIGYMCNKMMNMLFPY